MSIFARIVNYKILADRKSENLKESIVDNKKAYKESQKETGGDKMQYIEIKKKDSNKTDNSNNHYFAPLKIIAVSIFALLIAYLPYYFIYSTSLKNFLLAVFYPLSPNVTYSFMSGRFVSGLFCFMIWPAIFFLIVGIKILFSAYKHKFTNNIFSVLTFYSPAMWL
ncbi:hypothetical protein SAMN02746089_02793, partial [Caldanaerobius fijiensis DSM 17918]